MFYFPFPVIVFFLPFFFSLFNLHFIQYLVHGCVQNRLLRYYSYQGWRQVEYVVRFNCIVCRFYQRKTYPVVYHFGTILRICEYTTGACCIYPTSLKCVWWRIQSSNTPILKKNTFWEYFPCEINCRFRISAVVWWQIENILFFFLNLRMYLAIQPAS